MSLSEKEQKSKLLKNTIIFFVILGLIVFVLRLNSKNPFIADTMEGGDSKEINPGTYTVRVERSIGKYGTTFVGVLQVEGNKVSLVKGYIRGSTGANISIGGTSLGIGIANPEFWIEKEKINDSNHAIKYSVIVSHKLIRLFILNERKTILVGSVLLFPKSRSKEIDQTMK